MPNLPSGLRPFHQPSSKVSISVIISPGSKVISSSFSEKKKIKKIKKVNTVDILPCIFTQSYILCRLQDKIKGFKSFSYLGISIYSAKKIIQIETNLIEKHTLNKAEEHSRIVYLYQWFLSANSTNFTCLIIIQSSCCFSLATTWGLRLQMKVRSKKLLYFHWQNDTPFKMLVLLSRGLKSTNYHFVRPICAHKKKNTIA